MSSDNIADTVRATRYRNKILGTGFVWGVIGAVLVSSYFFVLGQVGENPLGRKAYAFIGISAIAYIGGMFWFRYKRNGGVLSGVQGILIGFVINVTLTLLVALFIKIWFDFSAQGREITQLYLDDMLQLMEEGRAYGEQNFGKETYDQTVQQVAKTTTSDMALDFAIKIFATGLFNTFLYMLFLRKR